MGFFLDTIHPKGARTKAKKTMKIRPRNHEYEQAAGLPEDPAHLAAWQLHALDELYRLAGLAPWHAYQAAYADLQSLFEHLPAAKAS